MAGRCSNPFARVKTAIISALVMFGIAVVISMAVAGLMKLLFVAIRRFNTPKEG